MTQTT